MKYLSLERSDILRCHRFGFNGMEKDDDVKGAGNSLDFGARVYDSRLGRWLSLDPHFAKYPSMSTFCGMNNSPILVIDPTGKGGIVSNITRDAAGNYHGVLTFNVFMYSDEVPLETITNGLVESGMGDGFGFKSVGFILAKKGRDQVNIYLDIQVNITVIDASTAQEMIESETAASNNYIYVNSTDSKGRPVGYFGGSNLDGTNQGSFSVNSYADNRASSLLMHELWHSVARYTKESDPGRGTWTYGAHNTAEMGSVMNGGVITDESYLTQQDLYATGARQPSTWNSGSGTMTTHSSTLNLDPGKSNYEIGGPVNNNYLLTNSENKCVLLQEGDCN